MKTPLRLAFSIALLFVATAGPVSAADTAESVWSGASGSAWPTAGNWSAGVPSSTVSAEFDSTFTNQPTPTAAFAAQGLWLAIGLGQAVTINGAAAYAFTLDGSATLNGNANTGILLDNTGNFGLTLGSNVATTVTNSTSFLVNNASTLTVAGGLTIGAGQTLTLGGTNAAGTTTISGTIANTTGAVVVNTAGTVNLSSTGNAFTGGLTVKGGTAVVRTVGTGAIVLGDTGGSTAATLLGSNTSSANLSNAISLGTTTGPLTIGLASGAATASATFSGAITGSNNLIVANNTGGTGSASLSGAINIAGTITNSGTSVSTVNASSGLLVGGAAISGVIASSVTGIVQNSATSALYLSGANTAYTAGVLIKNGTLFVSGNSAAGAAGSVITLGDAGGSSSATLSDLGTTNLSNAINLGGTTGTLTIASIAAVKNYSFTLSGAIGLNGHDLVLADNTTTTSTALSVGGTISGTGNVILQSNANSPMAVTGTVNNTGTITNSGAGTGINTISGQIGANVTSVVQNSAGSTLVLSRTNGNLYTGGTTVTQGNLLITNTAGSGTGNGVVAVGSGGIFGGSGIVAATSTAASVVTVASGGAISPGGVAAAIGTLTFNGASSSNAVLTMASGAQINFDLGASNTSDKIVFLNYVANDVSLTNTVLNITGAQAGTYTLFQFYSNGGTTLVNSGLSAANFDLVDSTGLDGYTATLDFTTTGDINLILAAVPEPSTWLLLGSGGGVGLVFVARRRLAVPQS